MFYWFFWTTEGKSYNSRQNKKKNLKKQFLTDFLILKSKIIIFLKTIHFNKTIHKSTNKIIVWIPVFFNLFFQENKKKLLFPQINNKIVAEIESIYILK